MMDSTLLYFIKANVLISIFTLLYILLFRKETHFHLNRYFLLAGMASALLFPAIRISTQTLFLPVNEFIIPEFVEAPIKTIQPEPETIDSNRFSVVNLLKTVYFVGIIFFVFRFVLFIRKLLTLIRKGVLSRIGNTFFVATNQHVQPFSFFNFFFYNAKKASETDFETIVAHEKVHVKQLHSIDLLITETLVVLFWFNPFVFLLKNAVRSNHEFLADATVLKHGTSKTEYLQTLAVQASSLHFGGFGSHFKSSTLKNRIIMITKKKSTLIKSWKYLIVLPIVGILFFSFALREMNQPSVIFLKRGETVNLPEGTNFQFFGESAIEYKSSDHVIVISDAVKIESEKLKFYGDKFEYDSENRIIKALGDSCFMETIDESAEFNFNLSDIDLNSYKFIPPIKGKNVKESSGYGMRKHPITKEKKMHNGIDFPAPKGTPVVAITDGKVRKIYDNPKNYGKFIIIDHSNGFSSLSAQLSKYNVKVGDKVKQGDVIGYVGSSGQSTGPHLHLELKKDGKYVNPADYIEKDQNLEH